MEHGPGGHCCHRAMHGALHQQYIFAALGVMLL
eukprot:CAMPEP_0174703610 /NCGR_PEP_ID=MMETSP1094-20130205/7499_1 /TAXON_ID=156173 /ORGANISM="Chrysochromulina brevifilum, Strain UTEX LB 985" /LENGTH=32 /DNA_ID= /DNA_START= /DNA_END= /DNA_ORIENTATION=